MNALELADKLDLTDHKEAAVMLRKQAEEIQYWKDAFAKAMALTEHMKHLETQVYGGTTK
jgi:hypothetical protein